MIVREAENSEMLRGYFMLKADEPDEVNRLTELLQSDGLWYDRALDAQEETDEL